ncbi:ComF family protein [Jeotgalibacillus marinus]|uniref:ComF family protein n=1 Tax=Jeotgalibacillus marinus TaxID=86667 RepID=A0ABV3Q4K6_9BACL
MSHCIICHDPMFPQLSWRDLFTPSIPEPICEKCASTLRPIDHNRICTTCSRPLAEKSYACHDCITWSKHPTYSTTLDQNRALYSYNDSLKALIKRFKYDRDYAIASCFSKKMNEVIKIMPSYDILTPIPLNEQRLRDRSFNQSEALLIEANLPYELLLTRTDDTTTRQAKKSKRDRHTTENPFETAHHLATKSILLIDDLYTTGTTIRHAAYTLKQAGAAKVSSVTVGR